MVKTTMKKVSGLAIVSVLLAWTIGMPTAWGQGKTRVLLSSIGNSELQNAAEDVVSAVVTEFNRAETLGRRPNLLDLAVTVRARKNIMNRWEEGRFFCNRTQLDLSLVQRGGNIYEVRGIPLIVGDKEQRKAVLAINREAEIIGFRYSNEPATGTIIIASEPSGAIVEGAITDDRPRTPVRLENVPEGKYSFTIRKESYETIDTTLSVKAHHSMKRTIQLTPTFGYLRVRGGPETVKIDGVERTPSANGRVEVDVGKHVVTLSRQYYQPYDTTITVAPGQTELVSPEFERKRVPIRVFSDPNGATVMIDGDTAGTAPLLTTREAGRAYSIRLDAKSHVPSKRMNVFAKPDSIIEREVTLSPVNMKVGDEDVRIENMRADRSAGMITITYDLLGKPDETYEVKLSIKDPDGNPLVMNPEDAHGAIGEEVSPGQDKKIYWRKELPEGAAMQITQGPPSVATSLTVGYFTTDFRLEGSGSDSPYDFSRPLKTVMFTGKAGLFSVGYDNFSLSQGNHWVLNTTSQIGGNVHIFRDEDYPSLIYMPIMLQADYTYTGISFQDENENNSQNLLNIGIGSGVGGRVRVGRFPALRSTPVINRIVVEGSLMFFPSGYFNLNQKGFKKAHVSRARNISLEVKIVDLVDTGAGRGLGLTLGYTQRILSRTSERPESLGEVLESAFALGGLERISSQQLFRIGINWQ